MQNELNKLRHSIYMATEYAANSLQQIENIVSANADTKQKRLSSAYLDKYRLCYVDCQAYFTAKTPFSEQWGDDWNDSPYEHNAEEPYADDQNKIIAVSFDSSYWSTPNDHYGSDKEFSVMGINAGECPWLTYPSGTSEIVAPIMAGTTLRDFLARMANSDSLVYRICIHGSVRSEAVTLWQAQGPFY